MGALATLSRNFQIQFLRPLIGREDVEVVLRTGSQDELLRGLDALALDVVLTDLAPSRDAASPWQVHRLDKQPVSLIGTPARIGPAQVRCAICWPTSRLSFPARRRPFAPVSMR